MSNVLILKIEDVMDVSGRGIVLAPGLEVELYNFLVNMRPYLKHQLVSKKNCKALFTIPFQSPPPKISKYWCHLSGLGKLEIPIGSNLWLTNADEVKNQYGFSEISFLFTFIIM